MNLPDITLFFQIIHFIFAYWILKRFIFEPSFSIIQQEEEKNQLLTSKLHQVRLKLKSNLEQQKIRWDFIKKSLMNLTPSIILEKYTSKFKVTSPEIVPTKLSQDQKIAIEKLMHEKLLDIS